MHKTTGFVAIRDNINLYYEEYGSENSETIILILGLGCSVIYWTEEFCQSLSQQGFKVICFDNRDVGRSSRIGIPASPWSFIGKMTRFELGIPNKAFDYDLFDMAEDTLLLMQKLGITQAHLVGYSMGGMISQIMAADYSESVLSVNLISSSSSYHPFKLPSIGFIKTLFFKPPQHNEQEAILNFIYQQMLLLAACQNEKDKIYFKELSQQIMQHQFTFSSELVHLDAILSTNKLYQKTTEISQPMLVVHGSIDDLLPISHAYRIMKLAPHAKLVVIDNMAHYGFYGEFRTAILKELIAHLESVRHG